MGFVCTLQSYLKQMYPDMAYLVHSEVISWGKCDSDTKKTLFFAFFQPNEALFKAEMSRYGQFWFHFIIYHVEVSRNDQPGPF